MKTRAKITIEVPIDLKDVLIKRAEAEDSDLSKLCRQILRRHVGGGTTEQKLNSREVEPVAA